MIDPDGLQMTAIYFAKHGGDRAYLTVIAEQAEELVEARSLRFGHGWQVRKGKHVNSSWARKKGWNYDANLRARSGSDERLASRGFELIEGA
jgi:hypothetical protein